VVGVSTAMWDVKTKMLKVTFDKSKTEVLKVEEAIALVGHDTELVKANNETYNTLPGCCKYDR
jgi:mercuric ion binding protein